MADAKIVTKEKAMQFNEIVRETEISEISDNVCGVLDYFELANRKDIVRNKIVAPSMTTSKRELLDILKKSPYYIGKGRCMINTTLKREVDLDAWDRCYKWLRDSVIEIAYKKGISSDNWRRYSYNLNNYVYRNKLNGNYINKQEEVDQFNEVAEDYGIGVRAKLGMKFTKLIAAFAKETEIDKIVDIQDASFTDNDGVFHERTKDFGWKKVQAEIGDALNVLEVKSPMYLSVNSEDILTMSCGDTWSSCHFVGAGATWNGDHTYSGCYGGGDIGYIRDKVTLICFTTKEGVDPDDWETGKSHRAMFAYEDGVLYEGRVYPDGRDGGDETIATTMRNFVQKVIADGLGENNVWTLKKGTEWTRRHVKAGDGYLGYRDWNSCEDGNISFLQSEITDMDHVISVGTYTICPCCGEVHYNEKCVLCDRCWENYDEQCPVCGEGIYLEDDGDWVRCEENDVIYCCRRCAERAGVYYCEDAMEYHDEDNCRQDDHDGCWYYYDGDSIFTSDGHWFHNIENAIDDGYEYAQDDGEWYPEHRLYRDSYDDYYYHDESEMIVIGDKTYHNYTNALRDGWSEEDIELAQAKEVG